MPDDLRPEEWYMIPWPVEFALHDGDVGYEGLIAYFEAFME